MPILRRLPGFPTALLCGFIGASGITIPATAEDASPNAIPLGTRGGFTGTAEGRDQSVRDRFKDAFGYTIGAGVASDYVYRGITQSNHQFAFGVAFEGRYRDFYVGSSVTSIRLPGDPAAELSFSTGMRPSFGGFDFDFGLTYFAYPGETGEGNSNALEFVARVDRKLTEKIRVAAGFGHSPALSDASAWSNYAAAGLGIDLPVPDILDGVSASFTTSAGYMWSGLLSDEASTYRLPAYTNWNAGVTFRRDRFHLDLRYYDTSLSREKCFVLTGDPNARPGGRPDHLNPDGLASNWCSTTVVAKFWVAFE